MAVRNGASTLLRKVKLSSGVTMPVLGLGTWGSDRKDLPYAIQAAVKIGYRSIDCAEMYGNEEYVGIALHQCFGRRLCKREDIFLTSKLSPYSMFPSLIRTSLYKTLSDLDTDYLDMYLVHWPHRLFNKPHNIEDHSHIDPYQEDWMNEIWATFESYVNNGTIRSIGVSNFTIKQIDNLLKNCKIPPAVNQVENHIHFQQPLMKRYLDSKGIVLQAYSPLGSPGESSKKYDRPLALSDETLSRVAEKHGATNAQVALAFLMAEGRAVLAKSVNPQRLLENFNSAKLELAEKDLEDLRGANVNFRLIRARFLIPNSLHVDFWDQCYEKKYKRLFNLYNNHS